MTTPPVGTLAQEAALLLDAVTARLEAAKDRVDEPARPVCPSCGHDPTASCTACPICRFLAVLRGERPELTARWTETALTVVQALRTAIAPADPASADQAPDPTGAPAAGQRTGLQHIDIQ